MAPPYRQPVCPQLYPPPMGRKAPPLMHFPTSLPPSSGARPVQDILQSSVNQTRPTPNLSSRAIPVYSSRPLLPNSRIQVPQENPHWHGVPHNHFPSPSFLLSSQLEPTNRELGDSRELGEALPENLTEMKSWKKHRVTFFPGKDDKNKDETNDTSNNGLKKWPHGMGSTKAKHDTEKVKEHKGRKAREREEEKRSMPINKTASANALATVKKFAVGVRRKVTADAHEPKFEAVRKHAGKNEEKETTSEVDESDVRQQGLHIHKNRHDGAHPEKEEFDPSRRASMLDISISPVSRKKQMGGIERSEKIRSSAHDLRSKPRKPVELSADGQANVPGNHSHSLPKKRQAQPSLREESFDIQSRTGNGVPLAASNEHFHHHYPHGSYHVHYEHLQSSQKHALEHTEQGQSSSVPQLESHPMEDLAMNLEAPDLYSRQTPGNSYQDFNSRPQPEETPVVASHSLFSSVASVGRKVKNLHDPGGQNGHIPSRAPSQLHINTTSPKTPTPSALNFWAEADSTLSTNRTQSSRELPSRLKSFWAEADKAIAVPPWKESGPSLEEWLANIPNIGDGAADSKLFNAETKLKKPRAVVEAGKLRVINNEDMSAEETQFDEDGNELSIKSVDTQGSHGASKLIDRGMLHPDFRPGSSNQDASLQPPELHRLFQPGRLDILPEASLETSLHTPPVGRRAATKALTTTSSNGTDFQNQIKSLLELPLPTEKIRRSADIARDVSGRLDELEKYWDQHRVEVGTALKRMLLVIDNLVVKEREGAQAQRRAIKMGWEE